MKIVDKITPRSYEVETALAKEPKGETLCFYQYAETILLRHPPLDTLTISMLYCIRAITNYFFNHAFGDNFDDHK